MTSKFPDKLYILEPNPRGSEQRGPQGGGDVGQSPASKQSSEGIAPNGQVATYQRKSRRNGPAGQAPQKDRSGRKCKQGPTQREPGQGCAAGPSEAQLVRVSMEVDGEVCLLLWQPAVGPWETLRVCARDGQPRPDVDAVLEAIQATNCLLDFAELEQATQVQLQVFEQHGRTVWTAKHSGCGWTATPGQGQVDLDSTSVLGGQ